MTINRSQFPTAQERRRCSRRPTSITARISVNGSSCDGSVTNISLGGLYLAATRSLETCTGRAIQLGFASDIGILEIRGTIVRISDSGLAIQFNPLSHAEELILSSLLDGVTERPHSIRLSVLLVPTDTAELLLHTGVARARMVPAIPASSHAAPSHPESETGVDRRLGARIALPASVKAEWPAGHMPVDAELVDVSIGGACLRMRTAHPAIRSRLRLRLVLSGPEAPATNRRTRILDIEADVIWSSEIRRSVGVRFVAPSAEATGILADLVVRHLSGRTDQQGAAMSTVISEPLECRTGQGRRIVVSHDVQSREQASGAPVIILAPSFGETKTAYVALAYHLAQNGLHTLRFDYTNHVGESDGDMEDSTLSGMSNDLISVIQFAQQQWPDSPIGIVATSLSARVALKALAGRHDVRLLISLAGVMDVQATLTAVHHEDVVGTYLQGVRRGITNVLGFNVNTDAWLHDAVVNGYADLRSTLRDAEQVGASIILFTAEHDAWVRHESSREVHAALREHAANWYVIPDASHRLLDSPRATRGVSRYLVALCLERLAAAPDDQTVSEPNAREIAHQVGLERARVRARHHMTARTQGRRDYHDHLHYLADFSDYWHLLDHIYRLLGPAREGAHVLDAGCGQGHFGMFLLINQAYRARHEAWSDDGAIRYLGTDLAPAALTRARHNFSSVTGQPAAVTVDHTVNGVHVTRLCRTDLNLPLPFADDRFDHIVCNLVLGYLRDPAFTLSELIRVLAPTGRLIVSALKPDADGFPVYCNHLYAHVGDDGIEAGRRWLTDFARMKTDVGNGALPLFGATQLAAWLQACGAQSPRIYSSFADQAFIAVCSKASVSRREALPTAGMQAHA